MLKGVQQGMKLPAATMLRECVCGAVCVPTRACVCVRACERGLRGRTHGRSGTHFCSPHEHTHTHTHTRVYAASFAALRDFGNTSCSTTWYIMAYLETVCCGQQGALQYSTCAQRLGTDACVGARTAQHCHPWSNLQLA